MPWLVPDDLVSRLGADPGTYADLIADAQAFLEGQIGWPVSAAEHVETRDGLGNIKLKLFRYPVLDVADVTEVMVESDGDFDGSGAVEVTDFTIQHARHLIRRDGQVFPRGTGNVRVTYTAGYPDDSAELADLKGALATLAGHWTNEADRSGSVTEERIGTYSYKRASQSAGSKDAPTGLPEVDAVIRAWRRRRRLSLR